VAARGQSEGGKVGQKQASLLDSEATQLPVVHATGERANDKMSKRQNDGRTPARRQRGALVFCLVMLVLS